MAAERQSTALVDVVRHAWRSPDNLSEILAIWGAELVSPAHRKSGGESALADLERPPPQLTDQGSQEMIRRPAPSTPLRSLRPAACGSNGTTGPAADPPHTPRAASNEMRSSSRLTSRCGHHASHLSRGGSVRQTWPPPLCSARSPAAAARARALSLTATTNNNLGRPSPPPPLGRRLRVRGTKRRSGSLD